MPFNIITSNGLLLLAKRDRQKSHTIFENENHERQTAKPKYLTS